MSSIRGIRVLALTLILVLAGCVTVRVESLNSGFEAQRVAKNNVTVFYADDEIPHHVRVAILTARGDAPLKTVVESLRRMAGNLGANAVIIREVRIPTSMERSWAVSLEETPVGGLSWGQALAIWVEPDGEGVSP